jgi:hypothetical protein
LDNIINQTIKMVMKLVMHELFGKQAMTTNKSAKVIIVTDSDRVRQQRQSQHQ